MSRKHSNDAEQLRALERERDHALAEAEAAIESLHGLTADLEVASTARNEWRVCATMLYQKGHHSAQCNSGKGSNCTCGLSKALKEFERLQDEDKKKAGSQ